jgi:hypothetical protein
MEKMDMATAKLAATRAKTRTLEAQVQRFRGEDSDRRDDDNKEKRAGLTFLLDVAHQAATGLEDDLETLRNRLNPVLDQDSNRGEEGKDDDSSVPPAILQLERLVRRIESASAAVRFLADNARI